MSAYFIIQINITNPENYKDYITQVTPMLKNLEENTLLGVVNLKMLKEIGHTKELLY